MEQKRRNTAIAVIIGIAVIAAILVAGTMWIASSSNRDSDEAVRAVSMLYLDELAGRRAQVVEANIQNSTETIQTAVDMMTVDDLSDEAHRRAYQERMRELYHLERFAFVGESGIIYTADGPKEEIETYDFDYKTISGPEVSIREGEDGDKHVVIAVPISNKDFEGDKLRVCFEETDMDQMLKGISMQTGETDATFCNIYTSTGVALTDTVLGGLSEDDNLLEALQKADYDNGSTYEQVKEDFAEGNRGVVSFTYNDIAESLSYVPVEGTDFLLTYLIRESVISSKISPITNRVLYKSIAQALLTLLAMAIMFLFILHQNRKNAAQLAEKEAAEAAARVKQEEMEHRLELQEELLAQKQQSEQQDAMIKTLSSDYRSVYYLELDEDKGICYQSRSDLHGFKVGERFKYLEAVTAYCNTYVKEPYREDFLAFIHPDHIIEELKTHSVISYRYMIEIDGKDYWEAVRFAGVHEEGEEDSLVVRKVGACFVDVDEETRLEMERREALSEALEAAEQANRAKTAFLSNMSHEIRTPMNAIIGLDNIAMNDPETPEKTKEYLAKIEDSAEHLLHLINDILDMSRIESGKLVIKNEEFSFSKLLENINTMISGQCTDKGLDYQCRINGDVDDYYIGDNMKLRQILINILSNAVKFTPEGGNVELIVERKAQFENQTTMQFTISDNGIGMSEDFLPRIFDTFAQEDSSTTNKYGSTGLGLAITKSIVELMNGDIHVESEKGKGTTFFVTVSLMNAQQHDEDEEETDIHPNEMTVLIVDDDPVAREHARLVMEKAGIAAEIAESGAEAIDMVQLRHARREPYNLILIDWKMPEMDGVEATKRMREIIGHESAIIILTAYRWDSVLEEALAAGVDGFIPKPLFANAVLDEFKEALERKNITAHAKTAKADLSGRRILLAEDVQVNAEIMNMVLKARKMEADLAVNGRIAVEKFDAHEPGYYDAVLMDMRMPEMDGLEATRRIRAMDRPDAKTIPIIALTANAFDEDVQRSLQAGLNAHLSKPVKPESLYETLESLIKE